jgi:hypothetical protein
MPVLVGVVEVLLRILNLRHSAGLLRAPRYDSENTLPLNPPTEPGIQNGMSRRTRSGTKAAEQQSSKAEEGHPIVVKRRERKG